RGVPFTIPNEVSGGRAEGQRQAGSFGGNQASNAHGTAMGRREAYGARVYVCLTGDRGRCRNAGEDDPLLGLARLIRRLGEIRGASRRRRGHTRAKAGSASGRAESTPFFRVVLRGRVLCFPFLMCKEDR